MIRRLAIVSVFAFVLAAPQALIAAEPDETAKVLEKYKPATDKGLKWLAEQQQKDGHWEAAAGQYSVAMTSFAGLALLSEGSNTKDGKYAEQLRKAVEWMLACAEKDGRIANAQDKGETGRYMMSHGYAMLFLSQVYAKETDEKRHKQIGKVLEKAIEFAQNSQTSRGGWGYVSAKDGNDFDEGCATEIVLHGLFASRKAGVEVPKKLVESSLGYLKNSTTDPKEKKAGVIYSLAQGKQGEPRPALTAAAVALVLNAGEDKGDLTLVWLNFVQSVVPVAKGKITGLGHDEFTLFYFAQACYQLGEERHAKMRPDLAEAEKDQQKTDALLKWSRVRAVVFDDIAGAQQENGSWKGNIVGDVYSTAVYLIVLQLDKGHLPYNKR
jgi:hypothetical protein